MALQLAYRKMHGHGTPTYETASTRLFAHGRTDVIRTYSEDSQNFTEAVVAGSSKVSAGVHRASGEKNSLADIEN